MKEKKFRELPVLVKPGFVYHDIADSLSGIVERLTRKMFLIADEEKIGYEFYSKEPYGFGDHMEILSEVVDTVEVKERRFAYSAAIVKHFKIKLFFIPRGKEVHYTVRSNNCDKSISQHADSFVVEIAEDIVKYDEVLLFPFLYYLINKDKCPVEINEKQRKWALDNLQDAGIAIDSIEIDEESATPEFMEWFESVGLSLVSSGDVHDMLSDIANDKVYVVYGEFDPKTRENIRKANTDKEDEDND